MYKKKRHNVDNLRDRIYRMYTKIRNISPDVLEKLMHALYCAFCYCRERTVNILTSNKVKRHTKEFSEKYFLQDWTVLYFNEITL